MSTETALVYLARLEWRREVHREFLRRGPDRPFSHPYILYSALRRITESYEAHRHARTRTEQQRRSRMQQIASSSNALHRMLAFDDWLSVLEEVEIAAASEAGAFQGVKAHSAEERAILEEYSGVAAKSWESFMEVLQIVQTRSADYPTVNAASAGKKSAERLLIWEPIFDLWLREGKLGFAEHGPIIRILRSVHRGLSLKPPNLNSVKQAIRNHKRRGVQRW